MKLKNVIFLLILCTTAMSKGLFLANYIELSQNETSNETIRVETNTTETNITDNNINSTETNSIAVPPSQLLEDKNAKKLEELQIGFEKQSKKVEEVRNIIDVIDQITQKLDTTQKHDEEIIQGIKDSVEYFNRMDFKITTAAMQTKEKLLMINKKLSDQLENQLQHHVDVLEGDSEKIKKEVKVIDEKIEDIATHLPELDECSIRTNCTSCASYSKCGWCSLTRSCQKGSSSGPNEGSCAFWEFGKCSGEIECKSHNSCDLCISNTNCGWCSNLGSPICMNKEEGEKECHEDRFINMGKSLNICPHVTIVIQY